MVDGNKTCSYRNCEREVYASFNTCIFHTPAFRVGNGKLYPLRDENEFKHKFREYVRGKYREYREADENEKPNIELNCEGFNFYDLYTGYLTEDKPFDEIMFKDFHIPFRVNFKHAKFARQLYLAGIVFSEEVNFVGSKFGTINESTRIGTRSMTSQRSYSVYAQFDRMEFLGGVRFNGAKFFCYADFKLSEFETLAHFNQVEFHENVDFLLAFFECPVIFSDSYYGADANFQLARFRGVANFGDVRFRGFTDFRQTEYRDKGIFDNIEVSNSLNLGTIAARFERDNNKNLLKDDEGKAVVIDPKAELELRGATFNTGAKVSFVGTLLKKWSFRGTIAVKNPDIFDFDGAIWKEQGDKRIILNEERELGRTVTSVDSVAEVYRRLQINYESRLAYETASDFHMGHMRMLLKNPNVAKSKKFFLSLYKLVSNFGESVLRPVISFLILWGIFFLVWYVFPVFDHIALPEDVLNGEFVWPWEWLYKVRIPNIGCWISYVWDKCWLAFRTFLTLPDTKGSPFELSVGAVQRLVGVYVIALFILALRRAFRR